MTGSEENGLPFEIMLANGTDKKSTQHTAM
jgi:hypothetical protein